MVYTALMITAGCIVSLIFLILIIVIGWYIEVSFYQPITITDRHRAESIKRDFHLTLSTFSQFIVIIPKEGVKSVFSLYVDFTSRWKVYLFMGALLFVSFQAIQYHNTIYGYYIQARQCFIQPFIDFVILPVLTGIVFVYELFIGVTNFCSDILNFITFQPFIILFQCSFTTENLYNAFYYAINIFVSIEKDINSWIDAGVLENDLSLLRTIDSIGLFVDSILHPLKCFCKAMTLFTDNISYFIRLRSFGEFITRIINIPIRFIQDISKMIKTNSSSSTSSSSSSSLTPLVYYTLKVTTVSVSRPSFQPTFDLICSVIISFGSFIEDVILLIFQSVFGIFDYVIGDEEVPIQEDFEEYYDNYNDYEDNNDINNVGDLEEEEEDDDYGNDEAETTRIGIKKMILSLFSLHYTQILTRPICGVVKILNMTTELAINYDKLGTAEGVSYFQFGFVFDEFYASADEVGNLLVITGNANSQLVEHLYRLITSIGAFLIEFVIGNFYYFSYGGPLPLYPNIPYQTGIGKGDSEIGGKSYLNFLQFYFPDYWLKDSSFYNNTKSTNSTYRYKTALKDIFQNSRVVGKSIGDIIHNILSSQASGASVTFSIYIVIDLVEILCNFICFIYPILSFSDDSTPFSGPSGTNIKTTFREVDFSGLFMDMRFLADSLGNIFKEFTTTQCIATNGDEADEGFLCNFGDAITAFVLLFVSLGEQIIWFIQDIITYPTGYVRFCNKYISINGVLDDKRTFCVRVPDLTEPLQKLDTAICKTLSTAVGIIPLGGYKCDFGKTKRPENKLNGVEELKTCGHISTCTSVMVCQVGQLLTTPFHILNMFFVKTVSGSKYDEFIDFFRAAVRLVVMKFVLILQSIGIGLDCIACYSFSTKKESNLKSSVVNASPAPAVIIPFEKNGSVSVPLPSSSPSSSPPPPKKRFGTREKFGGIEVLEHEDSDEEDDNKDSNLLYDEKEKEDINNQNKNNKKRQNNNDGEDPVGDGDINGNDDCTYGISVFLFEFSFIIFKLTDAISGLLFNFVKVFLNLIVSFFIPDGNPFAALITFVVTFFKEVLLGSVVMIFKALISLIRLIGLGFIADIIEFTASSVCGVIKFFVNTAILLFTWSRSKMVSWECGLGKDQDGIFMGEEIDSEGNVIISSSSGGGNRGGAGGGIMIPLPSKQRRYMNNSNYNNKNDDDGDDSDGYGKSKLDPPQWIKHYLNNTSSDPSSYLRWPYDDPCNKSMPMYWIIQKSRDLVDLELGEVFYCINKMLWFDNERLMDTPLSSATNRFQNSTCDIIMTVHNTSDWSEVPLSEKLSIMHCVELFQITNALRHSTGASWVPSNLLTRPKGIGLFAFEMIHGMALYAQYSKDQTVTTATFLSDEYQKSWASVGLSIKHYESIKTPADIQSFRERYRLKEYFSENNSTRLDAISSVTVSSWTLVKYALDSMANVSASFTDQVTEPSQFLSYNYTLEKSSSGVISSIYGIFSIIFGSLRDMAEYWSNPANLKRSEDAFNNFEESTSFLYKKGLNEIRSLFNELTKRNKTEYEIWNGNYSCTINNKVDNNNNNDGGGVGGDGNHLTCDVMREFIDKYNDDLMNSERSIIVQFIRSIKNTSFKALFKSKPIFNTSYGHLYKNRKKKKKSLSVVKLLGLVSKGSLRANKRWKKLSGLSEYITNELSIDDFTSKMNEFIDEKFIFVQKQAKNEYNGIRINNTDKDSIFPDVLETTFTGFPVIDFSKFEIRYNSKTILPSHSRSIYKNYSSNNNNNNNNNNNKLIVTYDDYIRGRTSIVSPSPKADRINGKMKHNKNQNQYSNKKKKKIVKRAYLYDQSESSLDLDKNGGGGEEERLITENGKEVVFLLEGDEKGSISQTSPAFHLTQTTNSRVSERTLEILKDVHVENFLNSLPFLSSAEPVCGQNNNNNNNNNNEDININGVSLCDECRVIYEFVKRIISSKNVLMKYHKSDSFLSLGTRTMDRFRYLFNVNARAIVGDSPELSVNGFPTDNIKDTLRYFGDPTPNKLRFNDILKFPSSNSTGSTTTTTTEESFFSSILNPDSYTNIEKSSYTGIVLDLVVYITSYINTIVKFIFSFFGSSAGLPTIDFTETKFHLFCDRDGGTDYDGTNKRFSIAETLLIFLILGIITTIILSIFRISFFRLLVAISLQSLIGLFLFITLYTNWTPLCGLSLPYKLMEDIYYFIAHNLTTKCDYLLSFLIIDQDFSNDTCYACKLAGLWKIANCRLFGFTDFFSNIIFTLEYFFPGFLIDYLQNKSRNPVIHILTRFNFIKNIFDRFDFFIPISSLSSSSSSSSSPVITNTSIVMNLVLQQGDSEGPLIILNNTVDIMRRCIGCNVLTIFFYFLIVYASMKLFVFFTPVLSFLFAIINHFFVLILSCLNLLDQILMNLFMVGVSAPFHLSGLIGDEANRNQINSQELIKFTDETTEDRKNNKDYDNYNKKNKENDNDGDTDYVRNTKRFNKEDYDGTQQIHMDKRKGPDHFSPITKTNNEIISSHQSPKIRNNRFHGNFNEDSSKTDSVIEIPEEDHDKARPRIKSKQKKPTQNLYARKPLYNNNTNNQNSFSGILNYMLDKKNR